MKNVPGWKLVEGGEQPGAPRSQIEAYAALVEAGTSSLFGKRIPL
ncbi:MAG: hypothetical protein ACLTW9_17330 [Enterocloster sp.]